MVTKAILFISIEWRQEFGGIINLCKLNYVVTVPYHKMHMEILHKNWRGKQDKCWPFKPHKILNVPSFQNGAILYN